jgi:hypothetical protein
LTRSRIQNPRTRHVEAVPTSFKQGIDSIDLRETQRRIFTLDPPQLVRWFNERERGASCTEPTGW